MKPSYDATSVPLRAGVSNRVQNSSLPRFKLCLYLNYVACAIQLSSVGIAVLQAQRSFRVTAVLASTLAVFKGIGIFLGGVLGGTYARRVGFRRSILGALAGSAAILGAVPLLGDFTAIRVAFLVAGICYGMLKVAQYAAVGLISTDRSQHAGTMGKMEACYKLGSLLTFVVFAAFTNDVDPSSKSWLNAYWFLAAMMALAFILLAMTPLDESAVQTEASTGFSGSIGSIGRLLKTAMAMTLGLFVICSIVTEQGFINWLPSFNARQLNMTASGAIRWAGLFAVSSIIGRLFIGRVLQRVSWFPAMIVCAVSTAVLLGAGLLFALAVGPGTSYHGRIAALLLGLTGLFVGPMWPVVHSIALTSLPVSRQNVLASLSIIFSSISGAIGTPLLGWVFQRYGGMAAMAAIFVTLPGFLIAFWSLRRIAEPSSNP